MGCHRYEGYDKEPEDLLSIAQQIKQLDQEKRDNFKQAGDLMKQADKAESNEEANRLNDHAVALKVTNSKLDLRIVQLDRSTKSLLQDLKKVGPNLKDARLKLNKNWIPVWLKKPSDFRSSTKMPNFRLNDGHELQVQNMTVMPSLRLSPQDAEDVASYLVTLKKQEPSAYADASFMDDPNLKPEGKKWVRHFGCAGCHEISGLEDEGRIGTELTTEGSKPIERLDFALLTETAQRVGSEPITDPA